MTVVSAEAVDYRDVAELPAPVPTGSPPTYDPYQTFLVTLVEKGKSPITPEDVAPYFRQQATNRSFKNAKPSRPLIKVTFTSDENLLKYAEHGYFELRFRPYLCDRPGENPAWGWSNIFWRGLDLGRRYLNYSFELKEGEKLHYYAYLELSYEYLERGVRKQFDWRKTPGDVCFRVGRGWFGNWHLQNVAVIPKAAITEALNNLPPSLRAASPAR